MRPVNDRGPFKRRLLARQARHPHRPPLLEILPLLRAQRRARLVGVDPFTDDPVPVAARPQPAEHRDDAEELAAALGDLGFLRKGRRPEAERLMAHVRAVGGWYMDDREIEVTPEMVMRIVESVHDPRSEFYGLMRKESVPADEVMGRRMELGVVEVLGRLRARRNWHRIVREWVYADEPSTELGRQEWEYFTERGVARVPGLAARG